MTFNLTAYDGSLKDSHSIKVERVKDVGNHPGEIIEFQFPPIIKSDQKTGKWKSILNTLGYEPKYMYEGANPRKMSIETIYVVGGPPLGGGNGPNSNIGAKISDVQRAIRTWKKYFYFSALEKGGGQEGKSLPIWRISMMGGNKGWIPMAQDGSAWRCISYNVKPSETWVSEGGNHHPLTVTISMELEMATGVDVTGKGEPKQDHDNIANKPSPEWY